MLNTLEDEVAYFILLAISMIICYCLVILYALFKDKATEITSFLKDKGVDLSITAFKSVSSSFFCSVIIWGIVYFIVNSVFKIALNKDIGYLSFFIVLGLTYIGSLVQASHKITLEG